MLQLSSSDLVALKTGFLRQKQGLSLEGKIILAHRRIRAAYDFAGGLIYVSVSGGKDSLVLLHLVRSIFPDTPAVFVDTGLEYPEVRRLARSIQNVIVLRPEMRFDDVLKKHGYPIIGKRQAQYIREVRNAKGDTATRRLRLTGMRGDERGFSSYSKISDKWHYLTDPKVTDFNTSEKCCDVMKKKPFREYEKVSGRMPLIGVMADEGADRERAYFNNGGCNAFSIARPMSMPLAIWTQQDVLAYVREFGIEIPSVYGDIVDVDGCLELTGVKRTGCVFCGFGAHLDPYPNRFQRLAVSHPKLHRYCMERLGMRKVLHHIGVNPDPVADPMNGDNYEMFGEAS